MAVSPAQTSVLAAIPWHGLGVVAGGLAAVAIGAADVWQFHAFAKDTDLSLIYLGLGAFGVTGAFVAGQKAQ